VIQERNSNNVPVVSYTRGKDLSGSLEGAGGIGGLLARSHDYSSGNWSTHNFYHADGNGNITYLVNSSQTLAASYRYDPYGNLLSSSGSMAGTNTYRFSSKEWVQIDPWTQAIPGLYYYGYRFYAPSLQRWPNRDPIEELGGYNLYGFVGNDPVNYSDPEGLFFRWFKCMREVSKWKEKCEESIPDCPLWCPVHGEDGIDCEKARRDGILKCATEAKQMMKDCVKAGSSPPRPRR
jgi:RHS repeat-associated protein